MEQASSCETECPVCGQSVPLRDVNEHVDRCLMDKVPEGTSLKASPDMLASEMKRQHQSLLNFCSPSSSSSETRPPIKKRKTEACGTGADNGNRLVLGAATWLT